LVEWFGGSQRELIKADIMETILIHFKLGGCATRENINIKFSVITREPKTRILPKPTHILYMCIYQDFHFIRLALFIHET